MLYPVAQTTDCIVDFAGEAVVQPFAIEVVHPHWVGTVSLNPRRGRAHLALNGAGAGYVLKDCELELSWDEYPTERFRLDGGRYVHLDLLASPSRLKLLSDRSVVRAEVPESGYVAELRSAGSDLAVYSQVFIQKEYATRLLPEDASVVVDLGANVGMASLFFATRYPAATIIALEPDPENFDLLKRNLAQVGPRSVALQAAIWDEDRELGIKRADDTGLPLGDWGVQVGNSGSGGYATVMGWSMGRLIAHFGIQRIDILKIDIEGAEKELFEGADLAWLDLVDMVLVETHERFRPGSRAAVLKLLDHGFQAMPPSGENEIFVRLQNGAVAPASDIASRRTAIVTAYYKEDRATIERCIRSVRDQNGLVDHILVSDGHPQAWIDEMPVRHIKLDQAHGDYGNTPRGVGAILSISEGYDAIGFLDADNWLASDHVSSCWATAAKSPEVDFVIARWHLRRPNGGILASIEDSSHVDTNCFFFLGGSFHMLPHFSMMHKELSLVGDRVFYQALKGAGLTSVTVERPTVNYTCLWPTMYRRAGEEPPAEAKADINSSHLGPWLNGRTTREREIISRRAGIRFV